MIRTLLLLGLILSALLSGCSTSSKPQIIAASTSSPNWEERFDPWRACNRATEAASKGDDEALRTCFLAAYVRVSQPSVGGEDLEQMRDNLDYILKTLGDNKFASALQHQRPEVQSAVKYFINVEAIKIPYPKTELILSRSPTIDWPLIQAYRNT